MNEPVYFLKLEIEYVRCFGPKALLDLSDGEGGWKKWTVILGDNGTGKTTLLQILAASQVEKIKYSNETINIYSPIGFEHFLNYNVGNEPGITKSLGVSKTYVTGLSSNDYILQDFRDDMPRGVSAPQNKKGTLEALKCFGYGATRSMNMASLAESKSGNSETLFKDDAKLINAEEWLLQLDYAASKDSDIKGFALRKREQVKQILIDLLPDIENIRFSTPTKKNLQLSVEFKTLYNKWVTIHQLSLGYKTMVSWMVDLAARMFERYPDSDNPLAEPAIVLVDEIDLHLHPKWQRKIFDYLSERFPKTQFIVTAHSPLVVQSAPKDANIVLLRKEGDHVVIDNDIKSVQNWRLDQILTSDLFGLESGRGPEAEKWLEERKQLLQKESLTSKEKERLSELNKKAHNLPTADNEEDIEAMELIRKAADYLKNQKA